jgi:myosin-light-chain kinase
MGASKSRPWKVINSDDIRMSYNIGAILGVGTFGQVRECINTSNGDSYAVKIIDQCSKAASWGPNTMARREVELLAALNHPNIIHFIDLYEDDQFFYVIMERCTGGEIFEKIVKQRIMTESEVADIFRQMFSAIEYIHSLYIIHRDIKAENWMFTADGRVKLVDFGLAVRLPGPKASASEIVGSLYYMAPEMISRKYSFPVDMWSSGVLMFLLLTGRYPFDDETEELMVRRIQSGELVWDIGGQADPTHDAKRFTQRLLEVNPSSRITPLEALNDPFLRHKATSEKTDAILVPEIVTNRLSSSVLDATKSRRSDLLKSDVEENRSARLRILEQRFDEGKHSGRRVSKGSSSFSLPASPSKPASPMRQSTKGFLGHQQSSSTMESQLSPKLPATKRSRSLPGTHVKFDSKPPDVFVYSEGTGSLTKVGSSETRKRNSGK